MSELDLIFPLLTLPLKNLPTSSEFPLCHHIIESPVNHIKILLVFICFTPASSGAQLNLENHSYNVTVHIITVLLVWTMFYYTRVNHGFIVYKKFIMKGCLMIIC